MVRPRTNVRGVQNVWDEIDLEDFPLAFPSPFNISNSIVSVVRRTQSYRNFLHLYLGLLVSICCPLRTLPILVDPPVFCPKNSGGKLFTTAGYIVFFYHIFWSSKTIPVLSSSIEISLLNSSTYSISTVTWLCISYDFDSQSPETEVNLTSRGFTHAFLCCLS